MEKNLSKDSKITVMLMVIAATSCYEVFIYSYRGIVQSSNIEIWRFVQILLIELIYNTLLTIILYPMMQKMRIQNRKHIQKSTNFNEVFLRE